MSGRIYDQSSKATCSLCGSDMWLSSERNFWGPKCKNHKCTGTLIEAVYDMSVIYPGFSIPKLIEDHNKIITMEGNLYNEVNAKSGFTSYSLVTDVTDNGQLYYYGGYFAFSNPFNTNNYSLALKIPFKEEAEELCKKLNVHNKLFTYHVEEHQYF